MDKITFCIPSKNNLRYLKNAISSIRKNSFRKDHEIIVFIDEDKDGTTEYLNSLKDDINIKFINNFSGELAGVAKGYNECVKAASNEIVCVFHADMYLALNADLNAFKHLKRKTIISMTRIEPPLHPPGKDKIVKDFGLWPETTGEDCFKEEEFSKFTYEQCKKNKSVTSLGIFAPWMMYKDEYLSVGGHDEAFKLNDDIDIFATFAIHDYKFIQSWDAYVYHLTSRGWHHNSARTKEELLKKDRDVHLYKYHKEIIRKWGRFPARNNNFEPIKYNLYNIGIVINNCYEEILNHLEIYYKNLYIDCEFNNFIASEQPNTTTSLSEKIKNIKFDPNNDIVVTIDLLECDNNDINMLTSIVSLIENNKLSSGTFKIGNIQIRIK